jgi:hypothetical protein
VAILAAGTIAALYVLRSFDDNRLTSWQWVFADVDPARLHVTVMAGVLLAYAVARLPLPGRRPAAVLFLSASAVAVCFWRQPEVIVDASRYFTQAKALEVHGLGHFLREWGRDVPAWTDLPLIPLLHGLLFALFGESRVCVQAFNTLLFAGSVILTYGVGKALWDEEVGFTGGALLLGIPYLLTQVPGMLVDVPTMFFLALAVFLVVRAFQRGGARRILLASAALFLAFFSKYSAWLLLTVVPVIAVVLWRGAAPKPRRTALLMAAISGSLVVAAVLPRLSVHREQIALLLSYQAPGLRRWGEGIASTFLFQIHPFLTAGALLSVWMAFRRRDSRWVVIAWPVLLLLAFHVQRIRYWIPVFPMLALAGAYGLQAIRAREVRNFVLTCTVASSLVVALFGYLPFLRRNSAVNLELAGAYLDSLSENRVEVFTIAGSDTEVNPAVSVPLLDLFTRKALSYRYEGAPAEARRRAETSPLRFTWEYRNPDYYASNVAGVDAAVVVISDDLGQPLPAPLQTRLAGFQLAREFAADEGVFRHRTLVDVYRVAAAR